MFCFKNLFLLFFILFSSSIVAQSKKNLKPWKLNKTTTKIFINSLEKQDVKTPKIKNLKIWNAKISLGEIVITRDLKRRKLQGPKAKSYKPWED